MTGRTGVIPGAAFSDVDDLIVFFLVFLSVGDSSFGAADPGAAGSRHALVQMAEMKEWQPVLVIQGEADDFSVCHVCGAPGKHVLDVFVCDGCGCCISDEGRDTLVGKPFDQRVSLIRPFSRGSAVF